ncbi:MAG: neutral/alkaline non-lysosomal ceramidase N-terminal domain-containing protein [Chloroflexi bacterium]|nr:neutral/alkaline non-lysosomal ceramidase N-terminal domain-containing protein [Chloroflexota bacterium]
MNLGTSKSTITPPAGTPLAGYGFRDHGAEAVLDDLEVRVLWFQDDVTPSSAVCIVTADLIGFDTTLTDDLRTALTLAHGITPERVLLTASHTHSGPQTCAGLTDVGTPVPEVIAKVRQQILAAVATAKLNLRPVILRAGQGHCEGYAVNRRVIHDGRVIMEPNPDGIRDDTVTVIACHDATDDTPVAVLFHYTCHPTTMGDYRITADYPGAARRHVEQALGGGIAAFLQGCCGDVRPNCTLIGGKQFRRGQPEDVAAFGTALGETVLHILQGPMIPLKTALGGKSSIIDLPLARDRDPVTLEYTRRTGTGPEGEPSRSLAEDIRRPLALQRIDLAEEVSLIAMGGEVCCDYGHFIRGLAAGRLVLPLGYSNGLIGYIPSARMFPEGGYEVEGSCPYFGLPRPFSPDIESVIHAGVRSLMCVH